MCLVVLDIISSTVLSTFRLLAEEGVVEEVEKRKSPSVFVVVGCLSVDEAVVGSTVGLPPRGKAVAAGILG